MDAKRLKRIGGGGYSTDHSSEDGSSLLRRPSDRGDITVHETTSINLPPLMTRSSQYFIEENERSGELAEVNLLNRKPPRKGSIKANSWPEDASTSLGRRRRRSSVCFAPFQIRGEPSNDNLDSQSATKTECRMKISSMLPTIIKRAPSTRSRRRRRKFLKHKDQSGASSYVSLWVDNSKDLLDKAKHFGAQKHIGQGKSRCKIRVQCTFPSGFKRNRARAYFQPSPL